MALFQQNKENEQKLQCNDGTSLHIFYQAGSESPVAQLQYQTGVWRVSCLTCASDFNMS